MRFLLLAILVTITACASHPNAQRVQIAKSLDFVSAQLDRAEKNGWISNADEDRLQNRVIDGLDVLDGSSAVVDITGCLSADTRIDCAGRVLDELETTLRAAEEENQ